MITFEVQNANGERKLITIPDDINLSLMEVLKASEYPIEATCGGMALCATCYVDVLEGREQLDDPTEAELDMLDTLPSTTAQSRLACQIRVNPNLQDAVLQLKAFVS
ncbi:MAG TPA: 2Fe-2S iron-sulfur cluster-binding protein [Chryseosolibacter sp.]|nr:2Fe-2S iron-sulfur cluster-binding protein [Chryseosolibacter sp.]